MADACKKIEPRRVTIASILSDAERVEVYLPNEDWWLGGVQMGD